MFGLTEKVIHKQTRVIAGNSPNKDNGNLFMAGSFGLGQAVGVCEADVCSTLPLGFHQMKACRSVTFAYRIY